MQARNLKKKKKFLSKPTRKGKQRGEAAGALAAFEGRVPLVPRAKILLAQPFPLKTVRLV